jgi:hypothetical protein
MDKSEVLKSLFSDDIFEIERMLTKMGILYDYDDILEEDEEIIDPSLYINELLYLSIFHNALFCEHIFGENTVDSKIQEKSYNILIWKLGDWLSENDIYEDIADRNYSQNYAMWEINRFDPIEQSIITNIIDYVSYDLRDQPQVDFKQILKYGLQYGNLYTKRAINAYLLEIRDQEHIASIQKGKSFWLTDSFVTFFFPLNEPVEEINYQNTLFRYYPNNFSEHTHLKRLSLQGIKIFHQSLSEDYCYIWGMHVNLSLPDSIAKLSNLEILNFSQTQLGFESNPVFFPDWFENFQNLQVLHLPLSFLKNEPTTLAKLPHLKQLYLTFLEDDSTNIEWAVKVWDRKKRSFNILSIEWFQELLPNCEIIPVIFPPNNYTEDFDDDYAEVDANFQKIQKHLYSLNTSHIYEIIKALLDSERKEEIEDNDMLETWIYMLSFYEANLQDLSSPNHSQDKYWNECKNEIISWLSKKYQLTWNIEWEFMNVFQEWLKDTQKPYEEFICEKLIPKYKEAFQTLPNFDLNRMLQLGHHSLNEEVFQTIQYYFMHYAK